MKYKNNVGRYLLFTIIFPRFSQDFTLAENTITTSTMFIIKHRILVPHSIRDVCCLFVSILGFIRASLVRLPPLLRTIVLYGGIHKACLSKRWVEIICRHSVYITRGILTFIARSKFANCSPKLMIIILNITCIRRYVFDSI